SRAEPVQQTVWRLSSRSIAEKQPYPPRVRSHGDKGILRALGRTDAEDERVVVVEHELEASWKVGAESRPGISQLCFDGRRVLTEEAGDLGFGIGVTHDGRQKTERLRGRTDDAVHRP